MGRGPAPTTRSCGAGAPWAWCAPVPCTSTSTEALPDASVFKLGCTWPLPAEALRAFAGSVEALYVVEEASEYLAEGVRALGIEVARVRAPAAGATASSPPALSAPRSASRSPPHAPAPAGLPGRPPALCPGCPHRLVFKELTRIKAIVTGDIGCYTLGALPPLSAMDTCVDMGASVSMAHGFELALAGTEHRPVVARHRRLDVRALGPVSRSSPPCTTRDAGTVCVLDNRTTAMTGRQGNPFNGETLQKRPSRELDLEGVVRALGVEDVRTVDPHDAQCRARARSRRPRPQTSSPCSCSARPACCSTACASRTYAVTATPARHAACARRSAARPSRRTAETGARSIDAGLCIGCGQCAQYCAFGTPSTRPRCGERGEASHE